MCVCVLQHACVCRCIDVYVGARPSDCLLLRGHAMMPLSPAEPRFSVWCPNLMMPPPVLLLFLEHQACSVSVYACMVLGVSWNLNSCSCLCSPFMFIPSRWPFSKISPRGLPSVCWPRVRQSVYPADPGRETRLWPQWLYIRWDVCIGRLRP